jgi:IS5 family transposase
MRQERTVQASLFDLFAEHEIGRELKAMSQWLDEDRELIGPVAEDLRRHGVKETGRQGGTTRLAPRRTLTWTKREHSRGSAYLGRPGIAPWIGF